MSSKEIVLLYFLSEKCLCLVLLEVINLSNQGLMVFGMTLSKYPINWKENVVICHRDFSLHLIKFKTEPCLEFFYEQCNYTTSYGVEQ